MSRSLAREQFFDRMDAFAEASRSTSLLSASLVSSDRDASRLLRNGLAVVGLAAFEDFIVSRSREILDTLDPAMTTFVQLPHKLQVAASWGALQTLALRARFEKDPVRRLALIQAHTSHIASTASSHYRISSLAFAPQSTNLSTDDIENALKAVMVEGPWAEMASLASRTGYGGIDISAALKTSLGNRNEAAHVANADMHLADIQQLPDDLRVVGLVFDALLERAVAMLPQVLNSGAPRIAGLAAELRIRFIDRVGGRYREAAEGARRATKWSESLEDAIAAAKSRPSSAGHVLVLRDERALPMRWYT
jgi:hypothetical protein